MGEKIGWDKSDKGIEFAKKVRADPHNRPKGPLAKRSSVGMGFAPSPDDGLFRRRAERLPDDLPDMGRGQRTVVPKIVKHDTVRVKRSSIGLFEEFSYAEKYRHRPGALPHLSPTNVPRNLVSPHPLRDAGYVRGDANQPFAIRKDGLTPSPLPEMVPLAGELLFQHLRGADRPLVRQNARQYNAVGESDWVRQGRVVHR